MRLTASALLLAVFLGAWPAAARAADGQARAHFERAEAAFRARRFEDARLGYQAAYELQALPGLLFNIAQCHRYLENHERALFFYQRYLKLAGRTPNRARALELIAEQRAHLKRKRAVGLAARSESEPEAEPRSGASVEAEAALAPAATMAPSQPRASVMPGPLLLTAPSVVSPSQGKPAASWPLVARSSAGPRPLYRRWWFWTAAAAVVAGGVTVALLPRGDGRLPEGPLGSIDRR